MSGTEYGREKKVLRIGTRKSKLAMAQTMLVIDAVHRADPDIQTEIVPFVTTGDKILEKSLVEFGGKGVFVSEFEQAILDGVLDIAVHSAKDMPAVLMEGLEISAVLPRDDPRDVLVTKKGFTVPEGTGNGEKPLVIGTSSLRRQVQIMERRNVVCKLLRGNVNTRLGKLSAGEYDGIILAAAGMKRLGLLDSPEFSFEFLPELDFIPSGGQAVIAVEGRKDSAFRDLLKKIDHAPSRLSLLAEREVLRLLGAGCNEAVGVYSFMEQETFHMKLMKQVNDEIRRAEVSGKPEDSMKLAKILAAGFSDISELSDATGLSDVSELSDTSELSDISKRSDTEAL